VEFAALIPFHPAARVKGFSGDRTELKTRFSSATVLAETIGMPKMIYRDLNAASCLAAPPDWKWSELRAS
jgi:hypothetical protein